MNLIEKYNKAVLGIQAGIYDDKEPKKILNTIEGYLKEIIAVYDDKTAKIMLDEVLKEQKRLAIVHSHLSPGNMRP